MCESVPRLYVRFTLLNYDLRFSLCLKTWSVSISKICEEKYIANLKMKST